MIKSANVSIPLSELFPTLYSTDLPTTELPPKKHVVINPAMIFDPDDFEAYSMAMTAVFADAGTIKAIANLNESARTEKLRL